MTPSPGDVYLPLHPGGLGAGGDQRTKHHHQLRPLRTEGRGHPHLKLNSALFDIFRMKLNRYIYICICKALKACVFAVVVTNHIE